jgi:hypothetical protein
MMSLSAAAVCSLALGIAIAVKADVATIVKVARLIESRRRIGVPPLVGRRLQQATKCS